ncbi:hypothetical protein ZHAS_00015012 [Anopheles sinensis]|uniref:Uncharacterized protein n=1 Tax=Anopheles sinensis TaxID=74873 RepID=A0A084W9T2_ANOSI|nr:hypothetical protein ZHAS_00015012 [Anopheles sinensis]
MEAVRSSFPNDTRQGVKIFCKIDQRLECPWDAIVDGRRWWKRSVRWEETTKSFDDDPCRPEKGSSAGCHAKSFTNHRAQVPVNEDTVSNQQGSTGPNAVGEGVGNPPSR